MVGPDASGDTFLAVSYLAESAIKTISLAFYSALQESAPKHAYRLAYGLVRADGLGTWDAAIREATSQPLAGYLPPDFQSMLAWAGKKRTKPEDAWFRDSMEAARIVLRLLGVDEDIPSRQHSAKDLITALVQIRNKTKAHGAVGPDFFADANAPYIGATAGLILNCPVFSMRWAHLSLREKGSIRAVLLVGENPSHIPDSQLAQLAPRLPGVHVWPERSFRAYPCGELLRSNRECSTFLLPNGGYSDAKAEFLDYSSGTTEKHDVSTFLSTPVPPPPSETQGAVFLDVQTNVFGNLPPVPKGYVERKSLQQELRERLCDRNHTIITLHGGGGVGKTSLALYVAHQLASTDSPRFEYIIWFSARDVDLRPSGPSQVQPAVVDLDQVSRAYGSLFGAPATQEAFASVLQRPVEHTQTGILFIFDNFETMAEARDLHRFLDQHTHLPNKVLITSRERAFKADYPIEVTGMEHDEAAQLLKTAGRELSIEGLLTDDVIEAIWNYTHGHAYVMRVVVGEIAKDGRYVAPKTLMTRRMDIVNAVFERSFNKLSEAGRWVFLVVANWGSPVFELGLLVVLSQRDYVVEDGLDECERLSLISRDHLPDGQPCYSAPHLARVFARKKLEGDPDRLAIQDDLFTLQQFGVAQGPRQRRVTQDELIKRFIQWCMTEASPHNTGRTLQLDRILESIAELWPQGWSALAEFRIRYLGKQERIEYALRRAVEEMPFDKQAWLARMKFAEQAHDEPTFVSSLVSAVDADPGDVEFIREAAFKLCGYVNDHLVEIPATRRGVYLASVRSHMERVAAELDATGLSRLAWLFLLEENVDKAKQYANQGIAKDAGNEHCLKILDRISGSTPGRRW